MGHVGQFDWHGLVARLGAAHSLHAELTVQGELAQPARSAGSFAPHAAQVLASYAPARKAGTMGQPCDESFCAVNLTTSADSKAVSGISRVVAGLNAPGTEG